MNICLAGKQVKQVCLSPKCDAVTPPSEEEVRKHVDERERICKISLAANAKSHYTRQQSNSKKLDVTCQELRNSDGSGAQLCELAVGLIICCV